MLRGGTGEDTFAFLAWSDSQRPATFDSIINFEQGTDLIDLSALGPPLTWRGSQAFTGEAGEVRFIQGQNGTYVLGDQDGDRVFDLKIYINGRVTLTQDDFVL